MSTKRQGTSKRRLFSLAVISGPDRGKVMRTGRTKIRIGQDTSLDFSLRDKELADHHITLWTNEGECRIESSVPRNRFAHDRHWTLEGSNQKCHKIELGLSTLIFSANELDDQTIKTQIRSHRKKNRQMPNEPALEYDANESEDINIRTVIHNSALDLELLCEPPLAKSAETMIATSSSNSILDSDAKTGLAEAITTNMPKVTRPPPPKPQMLGTRNDKSVMVGIPEDVIPTEKPSSSPSRWDQKTKPTSSSKALAVRKIDKARPSNAWGDKPKSSSQPPKVKPKKSNAWGDPITPPAKRENKTHKRNSWGETNDTRPISLTQKPDVSRQDPNVISLEKLLETSNDPGLRVITEPDGEYANAIRLLSAKINEMIDTYGHRTFMISSALPLTGKTTTALNLALVLAEDPDRKVALVEADFRNPRLGEILQLENTEGLLNVVNDDQSPTDILRRFKNRNLITFLSGGRHHTPSTLLAAPQLKGLLRDLFSNVDVAIIDAPSVLPHADANLILPLVDTSLLVTLHGFSRGGVLDKVIKQIGKENVSGAISIEVESKTQKHLKEMRDIRMTVS